MRAHHFGPHPAFVGGMATVLALFAELRIGADTVTVHPTWIPHDRRRTTRLTVAALRAARGLAPDEIVQVHLATRGSFVREGAILAYAARRGLATVASLHGADFADFAGRHPGLVRRVLRHAGVVTALSDDAEAAVRRLAPGQAIRQIPNPILIQDHAPPAAQTDRVALFAGEIGTRKGADVLQRAWAIVRERLPGSRCIVIGPSGDFAPRADDSFTVLPAREPAAIVELLRTARVAVLPSRAEGMPMFLLEAMAAARPFVATPVGAIAALAENGGIVVPVGDHVRLADALVTVLGDRDLAGRLGRRGQDFCRATRSPEIIDGVYRQVYRDARELALTPS